MTVLNIGHQDGGAAVDIDLQSLVAGRLLVMSSSGGGKSWILRRLLEQSFSMIQHIVIDPDGDFPSLAERFNYIIVRPAAYKSMSDLALRVREHRISVILDVSDLDREEQADSVAEFLKGLLDAPREHWHPALVAIDEAQLFAPWGDAELHPGTRKLCVGAVTQLMSRGRKRGLAGVVATQRLAKLAKSVVSEVQNVLLGRCLLDLDVARAADLLGWNRKRAETLRKLVPGQFVAFGPALAPHPTVTSIGGVETTHIGATPQLSPPPNPDPETGMRLLADPAAKSGASSSRQKCTRPEAEKNIREGWTDEELVTLMESYADHSLSMADIRKRLPTRTTRSIAGMAHQLELRRSKSWTVERVLRLKEIFADPAGLTWELVAERMDMTVGSVRYKADSLGLVLPDAWSDEQIEALRAIAEQGRMLKHCLDEVGHSYPSSIAKAGQLGIKFSKRAGTAEAIAVAARRRDRNPEGTSKQRIAAILETAGKPLRPREIWALLGVKNSAILHYMHKAGEVEAMTSDEGWTVYQLPKSDPQEPMSREDDDPRPEPDNAGLAMEKTRGVAEGVCGDDSELNGAWAAVGKMAEAGRRITGGSLGGALGCSQTKASRFLKRLETMHLVRREGRGSHVCFLPEIASTAGDPDVPAISREEEVVGGNDSGDDGEGEIPCRFPQSPIYSRQHYITVYRGYKAGKAQAEIGAEAGLEPDQVQVCITGLIRCGALQRRAWALAPKPPEIPKAVSSQTLDVLDARIIEARQMEFKEFGEIAVELGIAEEEVVERYVAVMARQDFDTPPQRLKNLWTAVMGRLAADATAFGRRGPAPSGETWISSSNERDDAMTWFRGMGRGFRTVCDFSDMDPAWVHEKMQSRFSSGPASFG